MTGVVTAQQLKEVAGDLRGLLAGFDPDDVTVREAPGLWSGLEDIGRLVSGAQVLLARRVDESSAPAEAGLRNGAEWIALVSGGSQSGAYGQLTASRRLAGLPVVAAALRRGELSVAQVEEVAGAGAANPDEAERLVALAASVSLGELRGECARVRAAADPDPDATHERIRKARRLRWSRDREGAWCLTGRGTIDAGAEFEVVLRAITDEIFAEAHANGIHETRDAYAFDAAVEMARRAWDNMHVRHDNAGDNDSAAGDEDAAAAGEGEGEGVAPAECSLSNTGGDVSGRGSLDDDVTAGPVVKSPRARRRGAGVNPKTRAVVRVDLEALVRGRVDGDETCEIAGLGPVPVSVARELLGDATLHLVLTKGTQVANVTYLGRGPNTAQRIALLWTAPQCTRLGCHQRATEHDHRAPYADKPETVLENIDGYCHRDHDLKTYEGWALITGTGRREMVPPTDPRHPGKPTFHKRKHRTPTT